MKALSIRQPWACLIAHGFKNIENRTRPTKVRGDVLIHASSIMTRADYSACALFCSGLPDGTLPEGFEFPSFESLREQRGGVVGIMHLSDCVAQSDSPWFCGPYGYVIDRAIPLPFFPCKGRLGFFEIQMPKLDKVQG